MKTLRRIVQIVAGLAVLLVLIFPPFKYEWQTATRSYTGSLGNHYVLKAPDNPIEILRAARQELAQHADDSASHRPFDHTRDSITAAIDPARLLLELLAITAFAAIATWLIDKRIAANEDVVRIP